MTSTDTATREIAECGCTWVYVEEWENGENTDRFITAIQNCQKHGGE